MPVAGKTAAELEKRADYFDKMIRLQARSPALSGLEILWHSHIGMLLSHIYFAVSEAYKGEFLYPDKRTDPTKQAAFTCAAIAVVKPLHSPSSEVDREEYVYMNQMLAMRCACGIVEHPFHARAWVERRRIYKMLERVQLPSTSPIIEEAFGNNGTINTDWKIILSVQEEFSLQSLVNLFVVYKDLKIFKTPPENRE